MLRLHALGELGARLAERYPGTHDIQSDAALYAYAHATPGRMHLLDLVKERLGEEIVGSVLDAGYGFDAPAVTFGAAMAGEDALAGAHVRVGDDRAGRKRAFRIANVIGTSGPACEGHWT